MFDTLVVSYLFLGGFGAGIMCVAAFWSLVFHSVSNRSQLQSKAFEGLKTRCYVIGFITLCFAALCLLADLGRPELFYLLFTRPTFSILSFGSFTLLASLVISGFLAIINLLYVPFIQARLRKVTEFLCVIVSLLMMLYTGVYVACMEAVPLWNHATVPIIFLLSSLSAGISAIFMVMSFAQDVELLSGWTAVFHRIHVGVLGLELAALFLFVHAAFVNPFAQGSLQILIGSEFLGNWFLIGAIGAGLFIPLAFEAFTVCSGRLLKLLPIDVLCIAGGLILRFCIIWSGVH